MALTIQSAMDLARIDLNDTDPSEANRRYPDSELLKHANSVLLAMLNVAPHLWFGKYDSLPNGELPASTPWPVNAIYVKPCAEAIVAYAETKDDEHVLSQRVAALLQRAVSQFTG